MVEGSCTRYRNLWLHFTELRKLLLAIYQNANFFFVSNPYKFGLRKLIGILELAKKK